MLEIHKKSSAMIELLKNILSPEYKIPYRTEKRAFLKGLTSSKTSNNSITENKEKLQLNICACLIMRSCLNKKERKYVCINFTSFSY